MVSSGYLKQTRDVYVSADPQVIYSVASPGFPGLYQTGIRMPAGVTGPRAAVRMTVGGNASNSVSIDVR